MEHTALHEEAIHLFIMKFTEAVKEEVGQPDLIEAGAGAARFSTRFVFERGPMTLQFTFWGGSGHLRLSLMNDNRPPHTWMMLSGIIRDTHSAAEAIAELWINRENPEDPKGLFA